MTVINSKQSTLFKTFWEWLSLGYYQQKYCQQWRTVYRTMINWPQGSWRQNYVRSLKIFLRCHYPQLKEIVKNVAGFVPDQIIVSYSEMPIRWNEKHDARSNWTTRNISMMLYFLMNVRYSWTIMVGCVFRKRKYPDCSSSNKRIQLKSMYGLDYQ